MKQEVWWVQSLMTVRVIILYSMKYKNDMHAPASHLDCLAFELSKLRF